MEKYVCHTTNARGISMNDEGLLTDGAKLLLVFYVTFLLLTAPVYLLQEGGTITERQGGILTFGTAALALLVSLYFKREYIGPGWDLI